MNTVSFDVAQAFNPFKCDLTRFLEMNQDESFTVHHRPAEVGVVLAQIEHREFLRGIGGLLQFSFRRVPSARGFTLHSIPEGLARIYIGYEPSGAGTRVIVSGVYHNPFVLAGHNLMTAVQQTIESKLP